MQNRKSQAQSRHRKVVCLLAGLLMAGLLPAHAAPAPWHQWSSHLDGARVCAQASPGAGWDYATGPFRDPHCRIAAPDRGERPPVHRAAEPSAKAAPAAGESPERTRAGRP